MKEYLEEDMVLACGKGKEVHGGAKFHNEDIRGHQLVIENYVRVWRHGGWWCEIPVKCCASCEGEVMASFFLLPFLTSYPLYILFFLHFSLLCSYFISCVIHLFYIAPDVALFIYSIIVLSFSFTWYRTCMAACSMGFTRYIYSKSFKVATLNFGAITTTGFSFSAYVTAPPLNFILPIMFSSSNYKDAGYVMLWEILDLRLPEHCLAEVWAINYILAGFTISIVLENRHMLG
jgi:hypothetical protein